MIRYFVINPYSSCYENSIIESNEKEYKNYQYWVIKYLNEDNDLHRLDGPAEEYSEGEKYWYKDGSYHREDGPAIEEKNYKAYYYNGEKIFVDTDKEFKQYIKMKVFL
jgi:hypothetical protein